MSFSGCYLARPRRSIWEVAGGSLATEGFSSITIGPDAPDAEVPRTLSRLLVAARTEALPFRDWQFAAVVSNHSLEHFERL